MEIKALRHVNGEIVDYTVPASAAIAGIHLRDLARPGGMVVTLVLRGRKLIIPRGSSSIEPGDHVFVAMRTEVKPLMDRVFAPDSAPVDLPEGLAVCFPGYTTLDQVERLSALSDVLNDVSESTTLSGILQQRGGNVRY